MKVIEGTLFPDEVSYVGRTADGLIGFVQIVRSLPEPLIVPYVSFLLPHLLPHLSEFLSWNTISNVLTLEGYRKLFSVLKNLQISEQSKIPPKEQERKQSEQGEHFEQKDELSDVKEFADAIWQRDDPLKDIKLEPQEISRIINRFTRMLKKARNERSKFLRKLARKRTKTEPVETLENPFNPSVRLLYLKPYPPYNLSVYLSCTLAFHSDTFLPLTVELAVMHEEVDKRTIPERFKNAYSFQGLLKGSLDGAEVLQAFICEVCGKLADDSNLCNTCLSTKHYISEVLRYLLPHERVAFFNHKLSNAQFQDIWERLKTNKQFNLAYRLRGLYEKASKFRKYFENY